MGNQFLQQIQQSLINRKQAKLPNIKILVVGFLLFTLVYIVAALFAIPAGVSRDYHFINESGVITALSAIFLALASAFSIGSLTVQIRVKGGHLWLWVLMALGFAFLSFDELLQFHERLGSFIGRHSEAGAFRNWNDVIVILYGVLAIPILIIILPAILRYRLMLELFITGFIFFGIHTLIDSLYSPGTTISVVIEESAKLYCVGFLALGAFIGFIGVLWNLNLEQSEE